MARLLISITELNHIWQGANNPLKAILDLLEQNPFAPFTHMELDDEELLYNSQEALRVLRRGQTPSAEFLANQPFALISRINRSPDVNTLRLEPDTEYLVQVSSQIIVNYIVQLANLLPNFGRCRISVSSLAGSPMISGLPNLPDCFAFSVGWYHLISPLGYEPYYSCEDLLKTPAYKVRELDNGWIEMYVYPEPLDYDKPESRERILAVATHLDACRKDRK